MGSIEKIKIGDLISCHYQYRVGIGYAKILQIVDRKTKEIYQEYGPVITGYGDRNSKIDIIIEYVGYDMRDGDNETDLGDVIEISNSQTALDPHDIYQVIDEEMINKIKEEWERMMNIKLEFLYKHVNKALLEGRKSINKLKLK